MGKKCRNEDCNKVK